MDPHQALLTAVLHLGMKGRGQDSGILMPVPGGRITSEYGIRADPFHGSKRFHEGIDIAAPHGSTIQAIGSGQVIFSGVHQGYGKVVAVKHAGDITTLYAHCWALRVKVGDLVEHGTVLGFVGDSGRATGPHLHLEVRVGGTSVDPSRLLSSRQHKE